MGDQYTPPPGPPPSYHSRQRDEANRHHDQVVGPGTGNRELASNAGYRDAHTTSSQVPRPSMSEYEPPSGPPPKFFQQKGESEAHTAPPATDTSEPAPPPYEPWLAVPDNALLPPPPSIWEERSPTANASWDDAARAHDWCRRNPLWPPSRPTQQTLSRTQSGDIELTAGPNIRTSRLKKIGPGTTRINSFSGANDTIFLSNIPAYLAHTQSPQTVYFEVKVISMREDTGIAIGFVAPPYPSWRLPGWHRASLGVHGDDGRRYVNNSYGGQDFTSSFKHGDVVGIGIKFQPPAKDGRMQQAEVFFTRNGRRDGGWNLHEERDVEQEAGDVSGLEGDRDLLAAVGCFGSVEFETRFRREDWMFDARAGGS